MKDSRSPRWLLVTDLDDTLDGDRPSLATFARECGDLLLVPNSSRPQASVLATLADFPGEIVLAGLITALGTEIQLHGVDCGEWTDRFRGWDRSVIDDLMAGEGLKPHRPDLQTPFKASFEVPASRREAMQSRVLELEPESRVIVSGTSDFDVIPSAAGKDEAGRFVADQLGITPDHVIVAGDSGNDLAMFEASAMAIAVGNARPELVDRADPARTYFARAPRAAGLLEGLRYWGALTQTHLT